MRFATSMMISTAAFGLTSSQRSNDINWNTMAWDSMGINWSAAWADGQSIARPTLSPVPEGGKATTTPRATNAAAETPFGSLVGLANGFTTFGRATEVSGSGTNEIGNIGSPQGSNMIRVANTYGYQYSNRFINTSPSTMTVVIWNKAFDGPDGVEANLGACVAPETPALSFVLTPGQSQIVAFQENSQVGWAEATSSLTASGAFDTTWGEANFALDGSGFDMSTIMNSKGNVYDMAITAEQTACVSDMTQNYWYAANGDANDPLPVGANDGSCYVPGQGATLVTRMGGVMQSAI